MKVFEFVILLVAIVMIGSILRAKYMARDGGGGGSMGRMFGRVGEADSEQAIDSAETIRLREEVKALKERIQVLERIATDRENSLAREIDELRDR